MKNKIFLLSAMLLATAPLASCNKGTVTLVLESGIGVFADGSTSKTLTVKKGTKFSALKIEAPTYLGCETYTWEDSKGNLYLTGSVPNDDPSDDFLFNVNTRLFANFYDDIHAVRGVMTGKVGGSLMDAIARQPEAEEKLKLNFSIYANAILLTNTTYDVIGMGKIAGSLMDAIARQPEAEGKLRTISTYCYERIIGLDIKDGRSLGMGKTGGSAMDAIARQPEATDSLFNALSIAFTGISVSPDPVKAYGIGTAGGSAMDAIARQPEAAEKITDALCLAIEYINNN